MKKLFVLSYLLPILLFGQFGNPKIILLENNYNFGKINEGEVVSHKFVIVNGGTDTLKITKVKASCGCTAAEPIKKMLIPGDSTSIEVKFDSRRRRGPQRKFVYIFSNDPENPQTRILFTANVIPKDGISYSKPMIKLSKYSHNFGNVKEGEVVGLTVKIRNFGDGDLKIKKVNASCGCTAVLLSDKFLKPNEETELKIEFDTKNLSGQVARTVSILSNDPKKPNAVLTLIANIEKEN